MITYDIPFACFPSGQWSASFTGGKLQLFDTRLSAITFAVRDSNRKRLAGFEAVISVEGADGRWRAFDPDMKPPDKAE